MIDNRLLRAYDEAREILEMVLGESIIENGFPITSVQVNTRLRAAHARCITKRNLGYCKLEFAPHMLTVKYEDLLECMIHEVLHTFQGCQCHTGKWKKYAQKVTEETQYNITRCASYDGYEYKPKYRYKVVCENCGAEWKYQRLCSTVKYPEKWKCSCGGRLKRGV